MEKRTKYFLAVMVILCLISCGKRTTSFERTEVDKDSLQINNSFELTQNATFTNIGTVEPFDNSKPMIIDGKKYFNVSIEFKKSLNGELKIKSNDNLSYTSSKTESKNKETQSNNRNLLWIGLTAVIGTILVLYITLKKYTS